MTKGDLHKDPVRLWLFGVISLIEMQMLRLIRERFSDGSWTDLLSSGRVEAAKMIFADRKQRNEEASASNFSDCLQICDKATVLLKDGELFAVAGFSDRKTAERFFSRLESLRNDLAHSNDILKGRWPELADLAAECEIRLKRMESYKASGAADPASPEMECVRQ